MIFTLAQSIKGQPLLIFDNTIAAWDAWYMLDAMKNGLVCAHICCAGDYENALEFYPDWLPE